jgi:hypothetical protein
VHLSVQGIPAEAKVMVDGKLVGTGPYEGKLPRGPASHKLRIEADGYAPIEEEIGALADAVLKLRMEKSKEPRKLGPALAKASATAAPSAAPPKQGGHDLGDPKPPVREIDQSDPYKKR